MSDYMDYHSAWRFIFLSQIIHFSNRSENDTYVENFKFFCVKQHFFFQVEMICVAVLSYL